MMTKHYLMKILSGQPIRKLFNNRRTQPAAQACSLIDVTARREFALISKERRRLQTKGIIAVQ